MKQIVNYFLTVLVLFVAWWITPQTISFANNGTVFLTALVMWLVSLSFILLIIPIVIGVACGDAVGCLITLVVIIICILASPIELYIASRLVPGFSINGLWEYILTSLALGIFHINDRSNSNSDLDD